MSLSWGQLAPGAPFSPNVHCLALTRALCAWACACMCVCVNMCSSLVSMETCTPRNLDRRQSLIITTMCSPRRTIFQKFPLSCIWFLRGGLLCLMWWHTRCYHHIPLSIPFPFHPLGSCSGVAPLHGFDDSREIAFVFCLFPLENIFYWDPTSFTICSCQ